MQLDDEKSLELIKQIFLNDTRERQDQFESEINDLKFKLNDNQAKIETYYPIVTELLEKKIAESEDEIANVFSPIISKALKNEISESREEIIDALYPIMGQTIKKYVSEAIKDVYYSINLKIDNALRRGIFSKKIKSKISGVSAADLILQGSFPFLINEIFLIHEKSGILISHVSSDPQPSADSDLISGMLTAIKDFVSDSFKSDAGEQNLYEIQYGDSKIILERGRYSYLAIVIKGNETAEFDDELEKLNSEIHKSYYKQLRDFNGEFTGLDGIKKPLYRFISKINTEQVATETLEKPKPIFAYLLMAVLFIIIIIYSVINIPKYFQEITLDEIITKKLMTISGLNINDIQWTQENSNYFLHGIVNSYNIRNKVDSIFNTIPEIKNTNNNLGVLFFNFPADSITKNINATLINSGYNAISNISFQTIEDKVIISGEVEKLEDKREIGFLISQVPGVRIVENNLEFTGQSNLTDEQALNLISNMKLYFDFGKTEINKNHIKQLDQVIPYIKDNNLELIVKGFSDVVGTSDTNLLFAKKRAINVVKYLSSRGIYEEKLKIENYILNDSITVNNNRKVEIQVNQ
jgi:outer membrane protein OmpA-like peptidoglycan-associated protein